jgi:hypothetical protein
MGTFSLDKAFAIWAGSCANELTFTESSNRPSDSTCANGQSFPRQCTSALGRHLYDLYKRHSFTRQSSCTSALGRHLYDLYNKHLYALYNRHLYDLYNKITGTRSLDKAVALWAGTHLLTYGCKYRQAPNPAVVP